MAIQCLGSNCDNGNILCQKTGIFSRLCLFCTKCNYHAIIKISVILYNTCITEYPNRPIGYFSIENQVKRFFDKCYSSP